MAYNYQGAREEAKVRIDELLNKYPLHIILWAIGEVCVEKDIILLTPFIDTTHESLTQAFDNAKRRHGH